MNKGIKHGTLTAYSLHKCRCDACKSFTSVYRKDKYKAHPKVYTAEDLERIKLLARVYRSKRKLQILQAKENKPCTDCGILYPYYVMDFDHIPERGKKSFNLGTDYCKKSPEQIDEEIKKCEVVCSNCHRERTQKRREQERNNQ